MEVQGPLFLSFTDCSVWLCGGFSGCGRRGRPSRLSWAARRGELSSRRARALGARGSVIAALGLCPCDSQAELLPSMWHLPNPGIQPVSLHWHVDSFLLSPQGGRVQESYWTLSFFSFHGTQSISIFSMQKKILSWNTYCDPHGGILSALKLLTNSSYSLDLLWKQNATLKDNKSSGDNSNVTVCCSKFVFLNSQWVIWRQNQQCTVPRIWMLH